MSDSDRLIAAKDIATYLMVQMSDLSPGERLDALDIIEKAYCCNCGGDQPEGGICQCWNDE